MSQIAYGYCRASDSTRKKGSVSLDSQAAAIREYCTAQKLDLRDCLEDDDTSGGKLMRKRKNGAVILAACVDAGAVLVVEKFDRAFRNLLDFCVTVDQLHRSGGTILSTCESFDLKNYQHYMCVAIMVASSEMMRHASSGHGRERRATRKAAGQRIAGDAQYGFQYAKNGVVRDNGTQDEVLRPNEVELQWIRRVLDWSSHGKSLSYIAGRLNEAGVPTRRGGAWTKNAVRVLVAGGRDRLARARKMGGENVLLPHDLEETK